jgi:hypothetical protein
MTAPQFRLRCSVGQLMGAVYSEKNRDKSTMHDERGTQLKGLQFLTSELSKLKAEVPTKKKACSCRYTVQIRKVALSSIRPGL